MQVESASRELTAQIRVGSRLDAPREEVWSRVMTLAGINDEMRPLLRMTLPRGMGKLDISEVEMGRPIGRSWILLFGLIPFDYDDLTLVRFDEGHGFLERSTMLSQRLWEHERTLVDTPGGGCEITDRVRWQPRLGFPARPLKPLIRSVFSHRHKRLKRRFGGSAISTG